MDLLVKLYQNTLAAPEIPGVAVKKACPPDKGHILQFVRDNFGDGWASECDYALHNDPISCYIAVENKKLIGFACYDATAKGFFGPTGVLESEWGRGVGTALLVNSLLSMKEAGYGYAVIGWADKAAPFYQKQVGATVIEGSAPENSVYRNLISV